MDTSNRSKLPVVRWTGSTNGEIGRQHGSMLRTRVHETWSFYKSVFHAIGADNAELVRLAGVVRSAVLAFDARYVEEMEGIATGAGLEAWEIVCLNARTEILVSLRGKVVNECTSIAGLGVLAQNWDWDEFLETQLVVADIQLPSHRLLTVTEPGMLAKTGVSSAGVGTALNVLGLRPATIGVPIHVLLRAALDAPSFDAAIETLSAAPRGTSSHIFVAAADGRASMVEFAGDVVEPISAKRVDVHTNHYLGCGLAQHPKLGFPDEAAADTCSRARYRRAVQLLADKDINTVDDAKKAFKSVLADRSEAQEWPICRKMKSSSRDSLSNALGRVGTVCTVVLDLHESRLFVTPGNPIDHPDFIEVSFD